MWDSSGSKSNTCAQLTGALWLLLIFNVVIQVYPFILQWSNHAVQHVCSVRTSDWGYVSRQLTNQFRFVDKPSLPSSLGSDTSRVFNNSLGKLMGWGLQSVDDEAKKNSFPCYVRLLAVVTLLPWLAQVISLVGWPKLVKSGSGGCLERSGDRMVTVSQTVIFYVFHTNRNFVNF